MKRMRKILLGIVVTLTAVSSVTAKEIFRKPEGKDTAVSRKVMQAIYEEVKTPHKFGVVIEPDSAETPTATRPAG